MPILFLCSVVSILSAVPEPDAKAIASPEVLRAASVFARMEAEASAAQHQPAGF